MEEKETIETEKNKNTEKTKSNLSLRDKYPKRVNYLVYGTYTKFTHKIIYPFKLFRQH